MNNKRAKGFSLIEVVVFIIVVSISFTGIFGLLTQINKTSVNPIIVDQAVLIADAYLQEIISKPFFNPNTGMTCPTSAPTDRTQFSSVCDYKNYFNQAAITDQDNNPIPELSGYTITVTISTLKGQGSLGMAAAFFIQATVSHPEMTDLTLSTYRVESLNGTY